MVTTESELNLVPPHSIEAEQAVIGALLISPEVVARIWEHLRPGNFYRKAHEDIADSIIALHDKSEPVDVITVSHHLRERGLLSCVGGRQYLTDLALSIATTANAEAYIKIVNAKADERRQLEEQLRGGVPATKLTNREKWIYTELSKIIERQYGAIHELQRQVKELLEQLRVAAACVSRGLEIESRIAHLEQQHRVKPTTEANS